MGNDMLSVRRLSRIYYKKIYFRYPLSFFDAFWKMGVIESLFSAASYLSSKLFKKGDKSTFEGWVSNRFGKRLYNIFFKTYTEKVWGISCDNISSDWARQRLQGLSLTRAIKNSVLKNNKGSSKTLYDEFFYPKCGPGDFYRRLSRRVTESGGRFLFNKELVKVRHKDFKATGIEICDGHSREKQALPVDYLFSSIPLPKLVNMLDPLPPEDIITTASKLVFRSFITVNIILDKKDVFPDQWIYVHSPRVKLGRIQNYKNWSLAMVADPQKTTLGLEYFCNEKDILWNMNDTDLIGYALDELEKIGIFLRRYFLNGFVVRYQDAYPIYFLGYNEYVDIIRRYLSRFSNIQTMGRAGLFRYDNSDRALLTGIYAASRFFGDNRYNFQDLDKVSIDY